jgi:hypothetical protein
MEPFRPSCPGAIFGRRHHHPRLTTNALAARSAGSNRYEAVPAAPDIRTDPQSGGNRVQSTIREARLKPEYASLYPGVQPGVWMPASVIGQQLLLWHLTAPATPQGERLMAEEHFEFRGGQKRVGSWINMRTRLADG